jgi:cobalt-zinc-cadmium efflux system membrane fusion protein
MVDSSAGQFRRIFITLGVPAAALVAVLLAWMAVRAHRSVAELAEVSPPAADTAELKQVRLVRPELEAAAGIEVAPVESRPLSATITCNGSAGFNQNNYVKVPPKAAGILRAIPVDVGQRVGAGATLAVVDSPEVGEAKAELLKAVIHEEHLRWQIEKYKAAAEGIPAKSLLESQHFLEEQRADTATIRARLRTFGLTTTEIADVVDRQDLAIQLNVLAPRGGIVVERHAVAGEPVAATAPLLAIADLDTMWVHLNVYESSLPSIRVGQDVTFYPDGLPKEGFKGKVDWISPQVDPLTRTIQLRAEVSNREGSLRSNMFGKGVLAVEASHDRLVVPQAAVQSHDGDHVVFVQKPAGVFEARRIGLGVKSDQFWEVTFCLAAGEKVATTGSFLLKSNLENPDFGKIEESE